VAGPDRARDSEPGGNRDKPVNHLHLPKTPLEIVRFIYHLPRLGLLFHRLLMDSRVPFYAKAVPILGLLYLAMPLDIIRDFGRSFFGYIDDLVVLYFSFRIFLDLCPPEVVQEHVEKLSLKR